jgi:hypothetical protein
MKYQAFVDIPVDNDWENIEVVDYIVSGNNPEEARDNAAKEAQKEYDDFYVWEISDEDLIQDES